MSKERRVVLTIRGRKEQAQQLPGLELWLQKDGNDVSLLCKGGNDDVLYVVSLECTGILALHGGLGSVAGLRTDSKGHILIGVS